MSYLLSAVCLSLGGTKLQVGALTQEGHFFSSPPLIWRKDPILASCFDDPEPGRFCHTLAAWVMEFLQQRGFALGDAAVVGIPFPGPQEGELWFSNNLTRVFRKGVALQREMAEALAQLAGGGPSPGVRVLFDAQCDAGGELYHPQGRLYTRSQADTSPAATVLNIATGIAAGFVCDGRVLLTDQDFKEHVGASCDGGAGQLGRHLWYRPDVQRWEYQFLPVGRTPRLPPPAIRMTEWLAGPALAARLLLLLDREGLLRESVWTVPGIAFSQLQGILAKISRHRRAGDFAIAARQLREASNAVAGALLGWADEVSQHGQPAELTTRILEFGREVARDLAGALHTWMGCSGWQPFGHRIILTGGVGIRFLASLDPKPDRGFPQAVEDYLPPGCQVTRSVLHSATEREAHLFCHQ